MKIKRLLSNYFLLYKQISREYNDSPKSKDRWGAQNSITGKLLYRPAGFLLAPLFVIFSFSANQVTLLSFFAGAVGNILFVAGKSQLFLPGSIILLLYVVLDFTDGLVARHNKTSTHFGKMMDFLAGSTIAPFIPLFVGYGVVESGILPDSINKNYYLLISASASIVNMVAIRVKLQYKIEKMKIGVYKGKESEGLRIENKRTMILVKRIIFHLVAGTSHLLLVVLVLGHLLYLYPIFFLALGVIQYVLSLHTLFHEGPTALKKEKL